ncbi:MAG: hypothetical protein KBG12_05435 [Syntrophobacterales bacterium]|nr:hypothetical protein [Syntrophobacterales bacterium]
MIKGHGTSSHSYIIKGDYAILLIDSGVDANFPALQKYLLKIGVKWTAPPKLDKIC